MADTASPEASLRRIAALEKQVCAYLSAYEASKAETKAHKERYDESVLDLLQTIRAETEATLPLFPERLGDGGWRVDLPTAPVPPPSANGWHDTPLAALDLPPQSLHALQTAGMETVGQATSRGTDAMALANCLVDTAGLSKRAARVAAQVITEYVQTHGGSGNARD